MIFFEKYLSLNLKIINNEELFLIARYIYISCEHNIFMVHSVQCVPYLIAMGTDPEPSMRNKADQQLVEIDKKYTGFIHVSLCSVLSRDDLN